MSKTCNFGDLQESLIRDRIVVGLRDNSVRKRLLQESKLTLKFTIDICKSSETTHRQLKAMNSDDVSYMKNVKKTDTAGQAAAGYQKKKRYNFKTQKECTFCGNKHPRKKELCPVYGKICSKCQLRNHFAVKCLTKEGHKKDSQTSKKRLHTIEDYSKDEDLEVSDYMMSIDTLEETEFPNRIFAKMKINGIVQKFQLDCGATVNVIPVPEYIKLFDDKELRNLEEVQKFAPHLAQVTGPIRELMKDNVEFQWDETVHGKCFKEIRNMMSQTPVLRYFDPKIDVVIECDASQHPEDRCCDRV